MSMRREAGSVAYVAATGKERVQRGGATAEVGDRDARMGFARSLPRFS